MLVRLAAAEADRLARGWHLLTAVIAGLSLLLQLIVAIADGLQPLGTQLIRELGYFPMQATILVTVSTAMLVPDRQRDGAVWRAVRLCSLLGVTVTGFLYLAVLPSARPAGAWTVLAGSGLHYGVPLLVVIGWLLFGPRARIRRLDLLTCLIWPLVWFAWTLAHGAVTGYYPYPFINLREQGYLGVFWHCVVIVVILLLGALAARWLDRRLLRAER